MLIMKAVLWTKYGSPEVLQLGEAEKPTPKDNEVLVKTHAAAVTTGDCEVRALKFPIWLRLPMRLYVGFWKPTRVKILGSYLAGEIEAIGRDVKQFNVGDQIFGFNGFGFGAYAEYICMPEDGVMAAKPVNMTYEEAATVPLGGLEALHFLGMTNIQRGQTILINGAGGSIGTFAVQFAKLYGAEVTAVDSGNKLEMLRSLGADHVIDHTKEDFSKNGRKYDVIFDVVLKSSFSKMVRSMGDKGVYLMTNPTLWKMMRAGLTSRDDGKRVIFRYTEPSREGLIRLKELIEAGKIKTVIDKRYRLEQTVEAHRYVESGRKAGNVVITICR
jgi:NADPH:quinone reductase-like Zn-dependent oxidoreductase